MVVPETVPEYWTDCPAWTAPNEIVVPETVPVIVPVVTHGVPVIVIVPARFSPWSCHWRVNVPDAGELVL